MDGAGDANRSLARELGRAGIASLRFTFAGEGREADSVRSTADTRLRDAADAYRYALSREGVDPERIGICGWSLGGATALYVAATHPDWFHSIVLWSPALYTDFLGHQRTLAEHARTALREGQVTITGWKTYTVEKDFFTTWSQVDLPAMLPRITSDILLVQGSQDFLPLIDRELLGHTLGARREAYLIGGADHIFNLFQPELGYIRRAMGATVLFFSDTLAEG